MCKYDLVRCHSLSLEISSTQLNKKKKKLKEKEMTETLVVGTRLL